MNHSLPIRPTILWVRTLGLIGFVVWRVLYGGGEGFGAVASLLLVGIAAFLGIMSVLTFSAKWTGILDAKQAFGLPEGTVRAVLTIAFIVLVGVLASFLLTSSDYKAIDTASGIALSADMKADDARTFLKSVNTSDGIAGMQAAKSGKPDLYDVMLYPRPDHRLKDDVSKQVLTMLSTILAAMIGFYFGARPGKSDPDAVKRAQSVAAIERVLSSTPKASNLLTRIETLLASTALTDEKRKSDRDELITLRSRLATLQAAIDEADQARLSATTTGAEMTNSALAATSAATEMAKADARISELERAS